VVVLAAVDGRSGDGDAVGSGIHEDFPEAVILVHTCGGVHTRNMRLQIARVTGVRVKERRHEPGAARDIFTFARAAASAGISTGRMRGRRNGTD